MFAYNIILMLGEDVEAESNLVSISQKTNYIKDWTELRKTDKRRPKLEEDTIPEEGDEDLQHPNMSKRQRKLQKQVSEKYDLKKCQKKLEILHQPESPNNKNIFTPKRSCSLPKLITHNPKQSFNSNIFQRKGTDNLRSYKSLQSDAVKSRLDLFQRKNTQSQKDLYARVLNPKSRYMPRSLHQKRDQKPQNQRKMKIVINAEELEKIKQAIFNRQKYSSIPQLISQMQGLPLIRTLVR